jgi:hypothetical protein
MKIRVYLKDPDGFSTSVDEDVEKAVKKFDGLSDNERQSVIATRTEAVWKSLEKFVEYQEYIGIVFDTENGTATVEERKK